MSIRRLSKDYPLDLIGLTVAVGAVAVLAGAVHHFYFRGEFMAALSYSSDERELTEMLAGWVGGDAPSFLLGVHGFTDYLLPHYWVSLDAPWQQIPDAPGWVVDYLPSTLVLFELLSLTPYPIGLGFYLFAMGLALMAPAWIALRGFRWSVQLLGCLVMGLLTGPALAALDRGNTQGFVPLLVFAFAFAVLRQRWGIATGFLVLAASIKVFPLVLILILVALRQWKWAAIAVVGTVVLAIATFPLVSDNLWPSAWLLVEDMLGFGYNTGPDKYRLYAFNVSLVGGLIHGASLLGLDALAAVLVERAPIIGVVYLVAVAPLLWVKRLDVWVRLVLAMSLFTAIMPITYPYGASWAIAAAALGMAVARRDSDVKELVVSTPRSQWLPVLIATALMCAPYPFFIPGSTMDEPPAGFLALVSAAVAIALPVALAAAALRRPGADLAPSAAQT